MTRALLTVAVVSLAAPPARADRCEGGPMSARPVNRSGAHIAGTGGIIVVGDSLPDWRFRVLNKVVRANVVTLAPGLAIYHPPPSPGDELVLEDDQHQIRVKATRAFTVDPPLAPPEIASITAGSPGRNVVTAKLVAKAPAAARIMVVSRIDRDRTTPLAWAFAWDGADSIQLFRTPGGCMEYVQSWIEPKRGDRVVLAWVDDTGRVSEPSRPVVIEGAKP